MKTAKLLKFVADLTNKYKESCRPGHGRFDFYEYFAAVYRIGRNWKRKKRSKNRAARINVAKNCSVRDDGDVFSVLIAASAPQLNAKTRSLWSRSMRRLCGKDVKASEVVALLRYSGGPRKV